MNEGQVQHVETYPAGGPPLEDAPVGATEIHFEDAVDYDEDGGEIRVGGVVLTYDSADLDLDIIYLSAPLTFPVTVQDIVEVYPPASETVALVADQEGEIEAVVPYPMRPLLPDGPREPGEGESVLIQDDEYGRPTIVDIPTVEPSMDAYFVSNAHELLMENRRRLGEVLTENEDRVTDARDRLSAAEGRITDAFSEIELKPDQDYVDAAKQQALDAAAAAEQLAGSKVATFAQDTAPTAKAVGDLWIDTDDNNKIHRWDGTTWVVVRDTGIAETAGNAAAAMQKAQEALSAAEAAQAVADGAIRTFYQPERPWPDGSEQDETVLGDMWFDTDDGRAYRWNGTAWQVIQDESIGQALAAAQNAQTTADGKITAWYQHAAPTTAEDGDLWYDTDDKNKVYFRSGSQWVPVSDTRIEDQAAEIARLRAEATDLAARAENLIANPSFENDMEGWTQVSGVTEQVSVVTNTARTGVKSLRLETGSTKTVRSSPVAVAEGDVYRMALWSRNAGTDTTARLSIGMSSDGGSTFPRTTLTTLPGSGLPADGTRWSEVAIDYTVPAGLTHIDVGVTTSSASHGMVHIDDASIKNVTAAKRLEQQANDIEQRALSRGTDLVTNGTGFLKSNYNFPSLTFTAADAPTGANGSFTANFGLRTDGLTTESIPIDATKAYRLSIAARTIAGEHVTGGRLYTYIDPRDSFGNQIRLVNFDFRVGTTTTLAAPLNPGDTTMKLTSAAGWDNSASAHLRVAKFWDYVDPGGKAWPPETYTRNASGQNFWPQGGVNFTTNTITLTSPYSGAAKPAGTPVSNGSAASSYFYSAWNGTRPDNEWEVRTAIISGSATPEDGNGTGTATSRKFPPGTASIRIGWLANYSPSQGGNMAIASISLSDAAAAQATADAAAAGVATVQSGLVGLEGKVDGKSTVYVQATAPTGLGAADKGDIWINSGVTPRIVQTWTGVTWIEADSRVAQAVADVATKITTYYGPQPGVPTGGFTVGDLWVDDGSKIHRWTGSAWQVTVDPKGLADQAEANAKAFATERTDGLAKTLWSTALPGTTEAPQNSTWYQHDAEDKIVAVFTQTAPPKGNSWVARPIRSEAIDNLDVGKLTAFSGTVNELVANTFATQLADIIEANIGNLTVTGDAHLDDLVAQTIAGDTASFMSLTVDQILAGFLQAEWIITESGAIIAGNPEGARVEIRHDGVRVYVVGPNGDPYEAVSMVNGEISFAVIGQDGTRLGGISSMGAVTGTSGTFSKDVKIKGTPVLGQVGGGTIPGWLDNLPRGVIARNYKSTAETSIVTGVERAYLRANATLYPGRQYRIRATMRANLSAADGALTLALRWSTTAPASLSSAQLPNTTTFSFPNASANHRIVGWAEGFLEVDVVTKARFLLTYKGDYGATPAASSTYLYVEDVGPTTPVSGGDEEGPDTTLYRSTWKATATRRYYKSGEAMPSEENGKIELWYWFATPTDFKNVGVLFSGGAVEATDSIEMGKTFSQALNGATIHKSEIFLKNKVWLGDHDEGYLALSSLSGTSLPSTKTIDATFWGGTVESGEGVWVEVPTSWFTNGANRGICIGDKDGAALDGSGVLTYLRSGVFHGINDAEPPLIRHTYSR